MLEKEPILSIIVPIYNHEKYIRQCINGILMQEVNFEYEVLIGEDCSTDKSANILVEIEEELPSNFQIFYREKNMGMGRGGNASDLAKRAKGKYIITLEGDDYWTYKYKLREQVEFLENHTEYVAVAHNCLMVDENGKPLNTRYAECCEEEYRWEHFLQWLLPGQLATIVLRKSFYVELKKFYEKYKKYESFQGDRLKSFLLLSMGQVYCIQQQWSAYRFVTTSGTSFSARYVWNEERMKQRGLFLESIYEYALDKGNKEAILTVGKMLYKNRIWHCFGKEKIYSLMWVLRELGKEKNRFTYINYIFQFSLKKLITTCSK